MWLEPTPEDALHGAAACCELCLTACPAALPAARGRERQRQSRSLGQVSPSVMSVRASPDVLIK